MFSIHRVILTRLLAAWLLASVAIGAGVYYIETEKIDDHVVALAAAQASEFPVEGLNHGHPKAEQLARLQERATEFVRNNFVVIELYDHRKEKLVEAVNPRHGAIEEGLKQYAHAFPADEHSHYVKYAIDEQTVVQVLTPLKTEAGEIAGYFEGVFIVDPETIAHLQDQLARTLAVALAAVLLAAIVFYPVILGLNRHVIRASRDILKGNLEMATALGEAIAKRDSDTGEHNFRVALYAIALGEAVGIHGAAMRHLLLGAFLHDVGKIGISDSILLKPGKLTEEEFAVMRTHVALGVDIVGKSEWLHGARDVIAYHHEKFDGSGYLNGLTGEDIPLNARAFAIVDVFDALTAQRPYKAPWPVEAALDLIGQEAGKHFDPRLAARFREIAPALHADISQAGEAELAERLRAQAIRYFLSAPASNRR
ncbi:MAG: response regulator containing a CheY-like receiver domain and an domain [Rhodocyclaceae bacterium]|nr:response regulator containing a CheY-like receiver domain and an domain [Rhodocyclaceae bacterium]